MTPGTLLRRRSGKRPAPRRPRPRPRIVDVTSHWRVHPDGNLRGVLVRHPDGTLTREYLPEEHPALVRYLERVAVSA